MPIAEENSPPYADADSYGFVLTGLSGVKEDVEASDCNPEGILLPRDAKDKFWAEFQQQHPGAWNQKQSDGSH